MQCILCLIKSNDVANLAFFFFSQDILHDMFVDMCLKRCLFSVFSMQSLPVKQFILKHWLLLFKGHWLGVASIHGWI